MTGRAINVIPLESVLTSEHVDAVLVPAEVVRLPFGPGSELRRSTANPEVGSFGGDVVKTDPGFGVIRLLLNKNVFSLSFDADKICVHVQAFITCVLPRFTFITGQVARTFEELPARLTDLYGNENREPSA